MEAFHNFTKQPNREICSNFLLHRNEISFTLQIYTFYHQTSIARSDKSLKASKVQYLPMLSTLYQLLSNFV